MNRLPSMRAVSIALGRCLSGILDNAGRVAVRAGPRGESEEQVAGTREMHAAKPGVLAGCGAIRRAVPAI
jgi:hypothetical protein